MRRLIASLALAIALAFPVSALAASSSGVTPESLSVAATISATFPAAQTYTLDAGPPAIFTTGPAPAYITIVGSNNPTGVTITATVDPWVQSGITIPTNQRSTILQEDAAGSGAVLTKAATTLPAGTYATAATVVMLASSTGPLAGRKIGIEHQVLASNFTVGGTYTSAAHYTASTNN